ETPQPMRDALKYPVHHSLKQLYGQDVHYGYDLVLSELEAPLLEQVMTYTRGNKTRAAILLRINRGTVRNKLKKSGMN
ncbi:helix-turn-helix domain-containing protein, partial [Pseudoalteromonas sp. S1688]|uniref:helix-turn-helix domain-containing protein n=1 Tax=Pseudoalteromonas sp. S1688 TaxID=579511 RepID=UPI00110BBDEB